MFNFAKSIKNKLEDVASSLTQTTTTTNKSSKKSTSSSTYSFSSVFNNAKQIASVIGTKILDKATEFVSDEVDFFSLDVTSENLLSLATAIDDNGQNICYVTYDIQFGVNTIYKYSILLSLNGVNLYGLPTTTISVLFKYFSSEETSFVLQYASSNYVKNIISPKSLFPSLCCLTLFSASHCLGHTDSFTSVVQPQLLQSFYLVSRLNNNICYDNLLNGEITGNNDIIVNCIFKICEEMRLYINLKYVNDFEDLYINNEKNEIYIPQLIRICTSLPNSIQSSFNLVLAYLRYLYIYMKDDEYNAILCAVALRLFQYPFPPLLQQLVNYSDLLLTKDYVKLWYIREIFSYLFTYCLKNETITQSDLSQSSLIELTAKLEKIETRTELISFFKTLPETSIFQLAIYLFSTMQAPLLQTSTLVYMKLCYAIHDPINRIHSIQVTIDMLPDMTRWAFAYLCRFIHYSSSSQSLLLARIIPVITKPDSKLSPQLYSQLINLYNNLILRIINDCELFFVPSSNYLDYIQSNSYLYPKTRACSNHESVIEQTSIDMNSVHQNQNTINSNNTEIVNSNNTEIVNSNNQLSTCDSHEGISIQDNSNCQDKIEQNQIELSSVQNENITEINQIKDITNNDEIQKFIHKNSSEIDSIQNIVINTIESVQNIKESIESPISCHSETCSHSEMNIIDSMSIHKDNMNVETISNSSTISDAISNIIPDAISNTIPDVNTIPEAITDANLNASSDVIPEAITDVNSNSIPDANTNSNTNSNSNSNSNSISNESISISQVNSSNLLLNHITKPLPPPPMPKKTFINTYNTEESIPSSSSSKTTHKQVNNMSLTQTYNPNNLFLYPSFYEYSTKRYTLLSYDESDLIHKESLSHHLHSKMEKPFSSYPHNCMICTVDYTMTFEDIHHSIMNPIPINHFDTCTRCNPWLLVPISEYKPINIYEQHSN